MNFDITIRFEKDDPAHSILEGLSETYVGHLIINNINLCDLDEDYSWSSETYKNEFVLMLYIENIDLKTWLMLLENIYLGNFYFTEEL